jgi:transposase
MAPQYVKPYVMRQKNDRADAKAICEAVQRPSMRFVAVKSEEQQSTLAIHRVRETLVAQKTQLINALRAHLAEFGIVAPQGAGKVAQLTAVVADLKDTRVSALASVLHRWAGWRRGRSVTLLRISPSCRINTMPTVATTFCGRSGG